MRPLFSLVNRHIRLYLADRSTVVFSLLGALIAVGLVLVFLRRSIVESMTAQYAGLISAQQAGQLLDAWLVASASVIAAATTGLGALGQFVQDRESSRWRDFLVAPLPRWVVTGGYLLAASTVSMGMTTLVYGLGTAYCLSQGVPLGAGQVAAGWGWLMLVCVSLTLLLGCAVAGLRTVASFTGLSVVVGALFGFLSETYVSADSLPVGLSHALHALPFAQASALVRRPFTAEVIAALPAELRDPTRGALSITLDVGSTTLTTPVMALIVAGLGLAGAVVAWLVMARAVRH
jgi:multidrug/hemolysin transport system permease protein